MIPTDRATQEHYGWHKQTSQGTWTPMTVAYRALIYIVSVSTWCAVIAFNALDVLMTC